MCEKSHGLTPIGAWWATVHGVSKELDMTELLSIAREPLEKALKDKSQSVKKYNLTKRMEMKLAELKKALKTKQFQKLFRSCIRSRRR